MGKAKYTNKKIDTTEAIHHTFCTLSHKLYYGMDCHRNKYRILAIVAKDGVISQNRLTEIIGIAPASMSTALAKLEIENLVVRQPNKEDKRTYDVISTEKGKELVKCYKEQRRTTSEFYRCLTAEEQVEFLRILKKLEVSWQEQIKRDS